MMRYLSINLLLLSLFIGGCGNENYYERKEKARLLQQQELNGTSEMSAVQNEALAEKTTVRKPEAEENNIPEINTSVENLPTRSELVSSSPTMNVVGMTEIAEVSSISDPVSVTAVTPVELDMKQETNRTEERNVTVSPSFDQVMKEKSFTLESDLKRLEMEQKKALMDNEQAIALATLEKEKAIAQEQVNLEQKKVELEALNQKEIELAKLASQKELSLHEKEMAKEKSLYEKEVALAKLETQKTISENEQKLSESKVVNDQEIALAKLEIEKEQKEKDLELYKIITAVVAGLVILILLIIYMMHRRNKKIELQLHEEELMQQKYMEASKQHNENLRKMLEIVTDEKTDKGIKKEIVRLLKDQGKQSDLIEHKK